MIHAHCLLSFALFGAVYDVAAQPLITAVRGVAITVDDLDRSVAFYRDILEFELVSIDERRGDDVARLEGVFGANLRVATLRLGDETIELRDHLTAGGKPTPNDTRGNDAWFQHIAIVVSHMDRAYAKLAAHDVEHASTAPQRLPNWNVNAAGIEAFYFKDPDRHFLELIHFPVGKGDPRWQAAGDRLFCGIDHTAIVVADTERALAFYRDQLGLAVVGGSENYGVEQEHLNAVFGARLRITTLRAPRGIGVELLDYLAPGDGRDTPSDVRPIDLAHWWTLLETRDAEGVLDRTRPRHPRWVSPGAIGLGEGRTAATLRDPDLHGIWLESVPSLPSR
jgi:catechol 2,3-dioxygenase-like lactoylglutathione lyase family enzyme